MIDKKNINFKIFMIMKKNLLFMLALLVSLSMVFVSCDDDNTIDYAKKVAGTYKGTAKTTISGDDESPATETNMSVVIEQLNEMLVKITIPVDDDEKYTFEKCIVKEDGRLTTVQPIINSTGTVGQPDFIRTRTLLNNVKVTDKKLTFTLTTETVTTPLGTMVTASATTEFEGTRVE